MNPSRTRDRPAREVPLFLSPKVQRGNPTTVPSEGAQARPSTTSPGAASPSLFRGRFAANFTCVNVGVPPSTVCIMKPRLILLLAVLMECALLFALFRPKPDPDHQAVTESTQWRNDPNPAEERILRLQIAWEEWQPRIFWVLLVVNSLFIATRVAGARRKQFVST